MMNVVSYLATCTVGNNLEGGNENWEWEESCEA